MTMPSNETRPPVIAGWRRNDARDGPDSEPSPPVGEKFLVAARCDDNAEIAVVTLGNRGTLTYSGKARCPFHWEEVTWFIPLDEPLAAPVVGDPASIRLTFDVDDDLGEEGMFRLTWTDEDGVPGTLLLAPAAAGGLAAWLKPYTELAELIDARDDGPAAVAFERPPDVERLTLAAVRSHVSVTVTGLAAGAGFSPDDARYYAERLVEAAAAAERYTATRDAIKTFACPKCRESNPRDQFRPVAGVTLDCLPPIHSVQCPRCKQVVGMSEDEL